MANGDDLWKIEQKVRDSVYKIELSGDMHISATFNVRNLTSHIEDEDKVVKIWGKILFNGGGWCGLSHKTQPPQSHQCFGLNWAYADLWKWESRAWLSWALVDLHENVKLSLEKVAKHLVALHKEPSFLPLKSPIFP